MKLELFQTSGCSSCAESRDLLKFAAEEVAPEVVWRDVDVTQELDYAVALGVMSLPALAIDGTLAFSSLPSVGQLKAELQRRRGRSDGR